MRFLGIDLLGATAADPSVRAAQQALKSAGFDVGKSGADGLMGKDTEKAIAAFWSSKGVSHAPIVDTDLLQALGVSRSAAPAQTQAAWNAAVDAVTPAAAAANEDDAAASRQKKMLIIGGGAAAAVVGLILALAGRKKKAS